MNHNRRKQIKTELRLSVEDRRESEVQNQQWQGKFTSVRQMDETLSKEECYRWLSGWRSWPTHTIASMSELYEQLLPAWLSTAQKAQTTSSSGVMCRLCALKAPENVPNILSGCSALAQNQYLSRGNRALKILFFEIIHGLDLIDSVPPWHSARVRVGRCPGILGHTSEADG